MEGIGAGKSCHFITNSDMASAGAVRAAKLSQFRAGYNHMAASIMLGGVLPMVLIGGCIGAIMLARKYQSLQNRRQQLKKYQRLIWKKCLL